MASGAQLLAKVSAVLARTKVSHLPVYLRSVTNAGGNSLLGVGQVKTNVDVLVSPTPVISLVKAEEVASGHSLVQMGDYSIIFPGTYAKEDFEAKEIIYGTEVLKIVYFEPIVFDATVVAWKVYARTVKN